MMRSLDLDVASEFLVMAATLAHIKSRMLLPVHEEGDQDEDPRRDLVEQLLEYQRYKEASESLREMQAERELQFTREPDEGEKPREEVYIETNLFDLLTAFREILSVAKEGPSYHVVAERFSVVDRMRVVMAKLATARQVEFTDLFEPGAERGEIIATFLAILELVRLHMIRVMQTAYGGEIFVTPVESND
jgi:segregation and condensation protein A